MSENRENKTSQEPSGYDKDKPDYVPPPPPPPPPPCPDPCGDTPLWGPPQIRPECCTPRTCCSEGDGKCCTWEEVDDPCVRAASADCGGTWAKIECKCESSEEGCCDEWDCGGYPQGTCVPCKPCEGLLPDPEQPTGGCDDPGSDECSSDNLRKQLDALNQCISSQQGAKAKLEADIKARAERATALADLIKSFDDIVKKYKDQRYKLLCKEDCLKGFYRDVSAVFGKYPEQHLKDLTAAINAELCFLERERCCQKNLEGRLSKVTKLIWEQQEAEKAMKKADQAVAIIKDLPKWMDERFKELEGIRDEIDAALNDVDPQKQKWAFYLFYWKFVPKFCKCFPFPFCCEKKDDTTGSETPEGTPPSQYQAGQTTQKQQNQPDQNPPNQETPAHLGCKPGDWHPSEITDDRLRALICCAWDYARQRKQDYLDATDRLADTNNNLEFIKKKVEADAKGLDDRIKSGLDKIIKSTSPSA